MNVVQVTSIVEDPNADVLIYQIVLIAHGWALKSWYFCSRLSIDQYINDSLGILLGGILAPAGEKQFAGRKRRTG